MTAIDLLAGKTPAAGLPDSLADNPQWRNFVKTISSSWDKYAKNISAPMMQWARVEVPQNNQTVFYPFSGPDFATVYQIFPNAHRYVMAARQNAAMPLDLGSLTPATTTHSLKLLTSAWQQFGNDGFLVIAVNVDRNRSDADAFLSKHPVDFQIVYDAAGKYAEQLGVHNMPTSFLIDRNGKVRMQHAGFRTTDRSALEHEIRDLLRSN